MTLATLVLFIPACFALNMAPGPNNLLSINNATRYGFRAACVAGIGRVIAFAGMIALAAMGLAVVLHASEHVFLAIKTLGAAYLFYLAIQLWCAQPEAYAASCSRAPRKIEGGVYRLMRQEFWVAAGNPKAIVLFTAFLPQFVDPSGDPGQQFLMLGTLFLLMEWIAIALYAYMGMHAGRWLATARARQRFNRGCAALLACAGLGLLAARRH